MKSRCFAPVPDAAPGMPFVETRDAEARPDAATISAERSKVDSC